MAGVTTDHYSSEMQKKQTITEGFSARLQSQNTNRGGKSIYNGTLEEPAWSRLVRESARFPDRSEKESQVLLPFWGIQSAHFSARAELNLAKKKKKTWENHNLFFSPSGFKLPSQLIVRHQIEARQQVIRLTEANRGESEYGKTSFYSHDSSSRWFIKCILLVYLPSLLVAEGVQGQRGFFSVGICCWSLLQTSSDCGWCCPWCWSSRRLWYGAFLTVLTFHKFCLGSIIFSELYTVNTQLYTILLPIDSYQRKRIHS